MRRVSSRAGALASGASHHHGVDEHRTYHGLVVRSMTSMASLSADARPTKPPCAPPPPTPSSGTPSSEWYVTHRSMGAPAAQHTYVLNPACHRGTRRRGMCWEHAGGTRARAAQGAHTVRVHPVHALHDASALGVAAQSHGCVTCDVSIAQVPPVVRPAFSGGGTQVSRSGNPWLRVQGPRTCIARAGVPHHQHQTVAAVARHTALAWRGSLLPSTAGVAGRVWHKHAMWRPRHVGCGETVSCMCRGD